MPTQRYQLPLLCLFILTGSSALSTNSAAAQPDGANSQVWATHRQIGLYELAYPFPSFDGTSIVFQGNMDGRWQLYRMSLSDDSISRLHTSGGNDIHPALSQDGRWLAFVSDGGGNADIHVLDLSTGKATSPAPHPANDGHPKWSSDGRWIYFNRALPAGQDNGSVNEAIFRVRPDGSDLELISNSDNTETFPTPSPDGRYVAFVEWFPIAGEPNDRNGEIIILDLKNGRRTNLTNNPSFDGYPHWGSSGRWIYFSSRRPGPRGEPEFAIFRMSPDGGSPVQITALDGRSDVRGMPSGDERRLFFNQSDDGGDHGARVQLFAQDLP